MVGSARVCLPCAAGMQTHGVLGEKWDGDGDSGTPCIPCTPCDANAKRTNKCTATVDTQCEFCGAGTWVNRTTEACDACAAGEIDADLSAVTPCIACKACAPHEVFKAGDECTATVQTTCIACAAGEFANKTASPQECDTCAAGKWDADEDPGTPCITCTVCAAGKTLGSCPKPCLLALLRALQHVG